MPARVSTGDRDAVLRQIRWCAAVQILGARAPENSSPAGSWELPKSEEKKTGVRRVGGTGSSLPSVVVTNYYVSTLN